MVRPYRKTKGYLTQNSGEVYPRQQMEDHMETSKILVTVEFEAGWCCVCFFKNYTCVYCILYSLHI